LHLFVMGHLVVASPLESCCLLVALHHPLHCVLSRHHISLCCMLSLRLVGCWVAFCWLLDSTISSASISCHFDLIQRCQRFCPRCCSSSTVRSSFTTSLSTMYLG
jgi:hypothetical protein